MDTGVIIAICTAAGGLAGVLGTKAIDLLTARSKARLDQAQVDAKVKLDENAQRFAQFQAERKAEEEANARDRAELNAAFTAMRNELSAQNLDLRSVNLKLQEDKTNYAIVNARLETRLGEMESHMKAADKAHESESLALQSRIRELEGKVRELEAELQRERAAKGGA